MDMMQFPFENPLIKSYLKWEFHAASRNIYFNSIINILLPSLSSVLSDNTQESSLLSHYYFMVNSNPIVFL